MYDTPTASRVRSDGRFFDRRFSSSRPAVRSSRPVRQDRPRNTLMDSHRRSPVSDVSGNLFARRLWARRLVSDVLAERVEATDCPHALAELLERDRRRAADIMLDKVMADLDALEADGAAAADVDVEPVA